MAVKKVQDPSFLGTLQNEVPEEASPLLLFMIKHARVIMAAIVLFAIVIAGYGIYVWRSSSALEAGRLELGRITVMHAADARRAALEKFLSTAPESLRPAALFALVEAAREMKDQAGELTAWEALEKTAGMPVSFVAGLGKAQALQEAGKNQEALAELEGLLPKADAYTQILVNGEIVDVAERLGNLERALTASEAIAANEMAGGNQGYWRQKAAALKSRMAANS